jgi:chemotaxis signal transduction protein
VGLLVDGVEDVLTAASRDVEPPPSNVRGVSGTFFRAILKSHEDLISIVDLDRVLADS